MEKRKMSVRIGFMPTRRNMYGDKAFQPASAKAIKEEVEKWLKNKGISYVNLDFLNDEGLLYHPPPIL